MSRRKNSRRPVAAALLPALLCAAAWVWAQPSQKPLTNRDGGGVSPNLVLMLDDSASMSAQHAPDSTFKIKGSGGTVYTVTLPQDRYYWMHPNDPWPRESNLFQGIVPANPYRGTNNGTMLFQMQMRSPDVNSLYYNPERRYYPWIKADKSRMPASPPGAAPFLPPHPAWSSDTKAAVANLVTSPVNFPESSTTLVLGNGKSLSLASSKSIRWYHHPGSSGNASEDYYPMIYYRLNKDAAGNFLDPNNFQNYSFVDINSRKTGVSKSASSPADWTEQRTLGNFPRYTDRTDCANDNHCTLEEEQQNFANWFTYYRSRLLMVQGALPEAFKDLEDDKVRLGWGRIHQDSGKTIDGVTTPILDSGVRSFGGSSDDSVRGRFISWLRSFPGNNASWGLELKTPLISALIEVGEYFRRSDAGGPWSDDPAARSSAPHKTCRRSYNLMVTDGYYSEEHSNESFSVKKDGYDAGKNYDGGNFFPQVTGPSSTYQYVPVSPYKDDIRMTMADAAMYYWATDLRPDLENRVGASSDDPAFWQHMNNFIVGMGVEGTLSRSDDWADLVAGRKGWPAPTRLTPTAVDDLWHAAVNSRGDYYSVKRPEELTQAVQEILGWTQRRELREAGVSVASTVLQSGNRKYVPLYRSVDWSGDILAYSLDRVGQAGALAWSASSKVPGHASRSIWTWDGMSSQPFKSGSGGMGSDNEARLRETGTYAGTLKQFVDYLRGDVTHEGKDSLYRARAGKLGDFVNGNPVVVRDSVNLAYTSLPDASARADYSAFLVRKAARDPVLFVGSNDGMLHAFQDSKPSAAATKDDGKEIFAYVPRAVLPNLRKLASKDYGSSGNFHQFFVDGSLAETDVFVNAPGDSTPSWRNYLLGSLGAGGRAVFALDVTHSPSLGADTVRWEIDAASYPDLGHVTAPIEAGVLPNGKWVAIFGNGAYSTDGKAVLFVVDLQTRAVQTLEVDASGSNGLGGVGLVRDSTGVITALYAGDLKGRLWKLDYSATAASGFVKSGSSALFEARNAAGIAQPITVPPAVFKHSRGGNLVVFGTGRLYTEIDAESADLQSLYGIWDKPEDSVMRPLLRASLKTRSVVAVPGSNGATFYQLTGTAPDWAGNDRGWVVDLGMMAGLRVIYPPQVVLRKNVMLSAISPARGLNPCEAGVGSGINFLFPAEDGLDASYPMFDVNGDGLFNSSDTVASGYMTGSDGRDVIVLGTPVCNKGLCNTYISIQNTGSQMGANIQNTNLTIKDRVWRRIINPPIP